MQITKLELNNFSSYEGVNTFDFSVEDDKPIILAILVIIHITAKR